MPIIPHYILVLKLVLADEERAFPQVYLVSALGMLEYPVEFSAFLNYSIDVIRG